MALNKYFMLEVNPLEEKDAKEGKRLGECGLTKEGM